MSPSPPLARPSVDVRGLVHCFDAPAGPITVLDQVELTVAHGEHVAVVGRSGSGKSTLLSLLGGLERPQDGSVDVLGRDLGAATRDELAQFRADELGFVFQHFGLLDTLTARENLELAGTLAGQGRGERRDRADRLLDAVGIAHRRDHAPPALSGGERQRVGIARALMNEPRLVLADEPTGNLDDDSAQDIAELLASMPRQTGATVVTVTHDRTLAARADRIVELRAGAIVETAPHRGPRR